jgi:hypothetical protein
MLDLFCAFFAGLCAYSAVKNTPAEPAELSYNVLRHPDGIKRVANNFIDTVSRKGRSCKIVSIIVTHCDIKPYSSAFGEISPIRS